MSYFFPDDETAKEARHILNNLAAEVFDKNGEIPEAIIVGEDAGRRGRNRRATILPPRLPSYKQRMALMVDPDSFPVSEDPSPPWLICVRIFLTSCASTIAFFAFLSALVIGGFYIMSVERYIYYSIAEGLNAQTDCHGSSGLDECMSATQTLVSMASRAGTSLVGIERTGRLPV